MTPKPRRSRPPKASEAQPAAAAPGETPTRAERGGWKRYELPLVVAGVVIAGLGVLGTVSGTFKEWFHKDPITVQMVVYPGPLDRSGQLVSLYAIPLSSQTSDVALLRPGDRVRVDCWAKASLDNAGNYVEYLRIATPEQNAGRWLAETSARMPDGSSNNSGLKSLPLCSDVS